MCQPVLIELQSTVMVYLTLTLKKVYRFNKTWHYIRKCSLIVFNVKEVCNYIIPTNNDSTPKNKKLNEKQLSRSSSRPNSHTVLQLKEGISWWVAICSGEELLLLFVTGNNYNLDFHSRWAKGGNGMRPHGVVDPAGMFAPWQIDRENKQGCLV